MAVDRTRRERSTSTATRAGTRGETVTSTSRRGESRVDSLHRTLGNRAVQELVEGRNAKTALNVSRQRDRSEREADRIARETTAPSESVVPRPSRSEGTPRESSPSARHVSTTPKRDLDASSARPLPPSVRSYFEPRFGVSFRAVRVHDDRRADELARRLAADAFTYGSDIYFSEGNYRPETASGRRLLAHELTHVVQQTVRGHADYAPGIAASSAPMVQRQRSETGSSAPSGPTVGPLEPGRERPEGLYQVHLGPGVQYLTPEEYDRLRRRTVADLRSTIDLLRGRARIGRETIEEFKAETHNWVGVISDMIADVVPPHPSIYDPVTIWCDAAEQALERGDLARATDNIRNAQQRYNEAHREWYNYREATIGGAEVAVTTLEVTRDVSFATAGALAGAAFVPAGAGLVAQGGVSALTAAGGKAVEETATRGSELYHGLRREWDVADFLQSIGTAGVTGFAGTLVSGPLARKFSTSVLGRLSDDAAGALARELSEAYGEEVSEQAVRRIFETRGQQLVADFLEQAVSDASSTVVSESIKAAMEGLQAGETITPEEFAEKVATEFVKGDGSNQFARYLIRRAR